MSLEFTSKQHLTDVGTRYLHLTELLDLWQNGLDVMNRYSIESEKEKKQKLENAIELLQKHLDNKSGYDYKAWSLRDAIDSIPKDAESIESGRGTPLKKKPRS